MTLKTITFDDEQFVLVPTNTGERLGESFLKILFDKDFITPYVERLNSIINTASKLKDAPKAQEADHE